MLPLSPPSPVVFTHLPLSQSYGFGQRWEIFRAITPQHLVRHAFGHTTFISILSGNTFHLGATVIEYRACDSVSTRWASSALRPGRPDQ